jgi:CRP-like cAMP-binding protein
VVGGFNRLLAAVPPEERQRFEPHLERVTLPKGKVLYDHGDVVRYAYFPVSGTMSMVAAAETGAVLQIAMICNEGFVGLPVLLRAPAPAQVTVRLPGEAYRIHADALLHEFRRGATLQDVLLQYVHRLLIEVAQAAVCYRYHSRRQRICRWLLTAQDCARTDILELTQEFIAEMLAIPRSAVSETAVALQERGLIRQRHGRIQILKRHDLQMMACECYVALKHDRDADAA